jgi:hypothetical protein
MQIMCRPRGKISINHAASLATAILLTVMGNIAHSRILSFWESRITVIRRKGRRMGTRMDKLSDGNIRLTKRRMEVSDNTEQLPVS